MHFRIAMVLVFIFHSGTGYATTVADVDIPDSAILSDNTELQLNGVGVRTKFFFDIYVGALYLAKLTTSPDTILNSHSPNRITMHFLYKELAKHKLTDAWIEGFKENNSRDDYEKLSSRLEKFNAMFSDTRKGDVIRLDYVPATGTEVWFNDKLVGQIPGADFNKALLKVWLGEEPADTDLKDAMLNRN